MNTLIFIDGALTNRDQLIAELPANYRYFILDPNRDGLAQIAIILGNCHMEKF